VADLKKLYAEFDPLQAFAIAFEKGFLAIYGIATERRKSMLVRAASANARWR
jgi:hypothetical protein